MNSEKTKRFNKKEPGLIIKIQQSNKTEDEKLKERASFFAWLAKVSYETLPLTEAQYGCTPV